MSALSRLVLALALAASGAVDVAAAAEPTPSWHKTPGGLAFRHAHVPEDTHQSVAFGWIDGSTVALAGKEALAALGPALIQEGPKGSSRSAMHEDLTDLQATLSLTAGSSFARGQLSAPPAKFGAAAQIFARVLADPALPADRLIEMQKSRALASRQALENPETLAQRLLTRLILGDGPHLRFLTGEPASFERINLADIEAWRRSIMVRDGIVIAAAGPMDPAAVGVEIDRIFASLPASGRLQSAPKPTFRAPGKLVVLERPVVQTIIAAGGPTSLAVTPDIVRAELAVEVLGRAFTGRLFRAVRERLGAAYGISVSLFTVDGASRGLLIRSAVANDKAKDALAAIRGEYAASLTEGLTAAEIEPLKSAFVTRGRERLRRAPALAAELVTLALVGFPEDFLATYEARLHAQDLAAINDDLRTKFPRPPLTTVMVAPSADGLGADCVIGAPEEVARCE